MSVSEITLGGRGSLPGASGHIPQLLQDPEASSLHSACSQTWHALSQVAQAEGCGWDREAQPRPGSSGGGTSYTWAGCFCVSLKKFCFYSVSA